MIKSKLFTAVSLTLAIGLAFSASAFSGGDGTADNPYTVSSSADFVELAEMSLTDSLDGVYFQQSCDISLEGLDVSIAKNQSTPFMGSYNGMDYTIEDAVFNASGSGSGLFIHASDATIKNINVCNSEVKVGDSSGGIVAKTYGSTVIDGCSFSGDFVIPSSGYMGCNAGGIAGSTSEDTVISDCETDVGTQVTGSPLVLFLGGIAGYNKGTITECLALNAFEAVSDNYLVGMGGIAGENTGLISGCESRGTISGSITSEVALLYIGGIAGHNNGGEIERTYNKASLYAAGYGSYPGYVGGISGYNQSGSVSVSGNNGILRGYSSFAGGVSGINYATSGTSKISDCLNVGAIELTSGVVGGIVGGNIAVTDAENVSEITSSMNLYELSLGNAAVGMVQTSDDGTSKLTSLYVKNLTDSNATTMTDAQLTEADSISGLLSEAWVYPQNGFLPGIAAVKSLSKAQVITTAIDKTNNKSTFTVYNPGEETDAVAVVSYFSAERLLGTKILSITASKGYTTHIAESEFTEDALFQTITLVDTTATLKPLAENEVTY